MSRGGAQEGPRAPEGVWLATMRDISHSIDASIFRGEKQISTAVDFCESAN